MTPDFLIMHFAVQKCGASQWRRRAFSHVVISGASCQSESHNIICCIVLESCPLPEQSHQRSTKTHQAKCRQYHPQLRLPHGMAEHELVSH